MATHFSVLAWRIPGMAEPGGLPSMGLHRVGHNWSDLAAAAAATIAIFIQSFIGRTAAEAPILWPPDVRADSLGKTLILGKIEGKRRRGRQRMRWLNATTTQWTWVCANSRRWWRTGKPGVLQSMGWQRVGHNLVAEQQQTFWYSPNMFRDSLPSCLPWAICSVWCAGPSLPIQILPFP